MLPILDNGLTSLVTDLQERGMLDDVRIVAWGEFGRTPRISSKLGQAEVVDRLFELLEKQLKRCERLEKENEQLRRRIAELEKQDPPATGQETRAIVFARCRREAAATQTTPAKGGTQTPGRPQAQPR